MLCLPTPGRRPSLGGALRAARPAGRGGCHWPPALRLSAPQMVRGGELAGDALAGPPLLAQSSEPRGAGSLGLRPALPRRPAAQPGGARLGEPQGAACASSLRRRCRGFVQACGQQHTTPPTASLSERKGEGGFIRGQHSPLQDQSPCLA